MKLAVIKLGSRVAYGGKDTSGGNGEAKSIIKMLHKAGASIDVYTKVLDKDRNPAHLTFYNIESEYENINNRGYEGLIVLNGNVNFFGGAEDRAQILNYWLINRFQGKVFYVYCDPSLSLSQIWNSISKKPWSFNWIESDINITRSDIVYISQPYNIEAVKKKIGDDIAIQEIVHYPMERFPCLNSKVEMKPNPSLDLSYGGTMRGNRRAKKMVKFYFGYEDLKVEMFGKMDQDVLLKTRDKFFPDLQKAPIFGPPVEYDDFMQKMNDTLCHVVIGDTWYEGNDMPQRCFESIWSNVITFIDVDMDPLKRVFPDGACAKFNYVKDSSEVAKRIKMLKDIPELREKVLKSQIDAINFDAAKYCNDFLKIIKDRSTGAIGQTKEKAVNNLF
jgi:hypothetical protein